jgi:hypothetical protein
MPSGAAGVGSGEPAPVDLAQGPAGVAEAFRDRRRRGLRGLRSGGRRRRGRDDREQRGCCGEDARADRDSHLLTAPPLPGRRDDADFHGPRQPDSLPRRRGREGKASLPE